MPSLWQLLAIRAHAKTRAALATACPLFTDTSEPRALDAEELPASWDYRHAASQRHCRRL